jgi:pilus assembly protein CpaC
MTNLLKRMLAHATVPLLLLALAGLCRAGDDMRSQEPPGGPVEFQVDRGSHQLEMVVNTSRILTLAREVPRALVNNPDVLRVVPIAPNQVQVSALKTGVTQVNLWDDEGQLYSLDVIILGDAQELQVLLDAEFPQAAVRVRSLKDSVLLSGRVDQPEDVGRIVRIAESYSEKVVNNIQVGGVQQVLLHVQVMEVSRTKLRAMGFDWAAFGRNGFVVQSVSGTMGQFSPSARTAEGTDGASITFGLLGGDSTFFGFLEALRENNLAKVLANPTLVTVSGRPASFNAGGEFPILVPQSLGTLSIEYKQYGTRVDFVPIVLGDGSMRLEVRPQVSELDNASGVTFDGTQVPGLRTRWVDTAVEMRAGQTLALAGLLQTRTDVQNRGLPWLADMPWVGAAFRRVEEQQNEVELVITVRPELVEALDPDEVPACLPGMLSRSPEDCELLLRGYMEKSDCHADGPCATGTTYAAAVEVVKEEPVEQELPAPVGSGRWHPGSANKLPHTGRDTAPGESSSATADEGAEGDDDSASVEAAAEAGSSAADSKAADEAPVLPLDPAVRRTPPIAEPTRWAAGRASGRPLVAERGRQLRPAQRLQGPSYPPVAERSLRGSSNRPAAATSEEDPGLFGRLGHDDLD